jgi:uncharacterized protein (UPF0335 family)
MYQNGVAGDRLRSFLERIERIDEDLKAMNDEKKDDFAEAKGEGFDVKNLMEVTRFRKQDQNERDERNTLLDLYLHAIETAPAPTMVRPQAAQLTTPRRGRPRRANPRHHSADCSRVWRSATSSSAQRET